MEVFETLCRLCKHRQGLGCAAYPDKIPLEIRLMHVDHRQLYPGDHGITFEPKDDSPRTLERLARVRLQQGRVPVGPNALDQRIAPIRQTLRFPSPGQAYRFRIAVQMANSFEELPEWCQTLILEAEVERKTVQAQ
jgi:hypothetical protein